MNSSFIENPEIVKKVRRFGHHIVISIDLNFNISNFRDNFLIVIKINGKPIEFFINQIKSLNVGEVMINFVNKDGTMSGYQIDELRWFSKILDIPVIACGGCGCFSDIITFI